MAKTDQNTDPSQTNAQDPVTSPQTATPAEAAAQTAVAPSTPVAEKVDRPTMAELSGVRYIGPADARQISSEDFARLGIADARPLEFNAENGKFIQVSEFHADAADWFASQPDEFELKTT